LTKDIDIGEKRLREREREREREKEEIWMSVEKFRK